MSTRIVYKLNNAVKKIFPRYLYRSYITNKPNLKYCLNIKSSYPSNLFLQRRHYSLPNNNNNLPNQDLQYLSFYKYSKIDNPEKFRDRLLEEWKKLGITGRIYVAKEGINAQMSVPVENYNEYLEDMKRISEEFNLGSIYLNEGDIIPRNCPDTVPFEKLTVKVRRKIVADPLDENVELDMSKTIRLDPEKWHEKIEKSNSDDLFVIDVRNYYESEIGRFEPSHRLEIEKFEESFDAIEETLKNVDKEKEIMLYCTGGIRCEKISAYLSQAKGFKNIVSLEGGINNYAKYIKETGKKSLFKGKNYQFDNRNISGNKDQSLTNDILSNCEKCGIPSDYFRNCRNPACNTLIILCDNCHDEMNGTCSDECNEKVHLDKEELLKYVSEVRSKHSKHPIIRSSVYHKHVMAKSKNYSTMSDKESGLNRKNYSTMRDKESGLYRITPKDILEYVEINSTSISNDIKSIFEQFKDFPGIEKSIGDYQGTLLKMIAKITKSNQILEIGTFIGFSALNLVENLQNNDGKVITLESNTEIAKIAQENFNKHPKGNQILLKVGNAIDTLKDLRNMKFDLIFVDANKSGYIEYYNYIIENKMLSDNGVMIFDNVLFRGEVIDKSRYGNILNEFNEYLREDKRTMKSILPIRDGITLVTWNKN